MTDHADLPVGQPATPAVAFGAVEPGVGIALGLELVPPSSGEAACGVGVAVTDGCGGVGAAGAPPSAGGTEGVAVGAAVGALATGWGSPLSSTSASTIAARKSASTPATRITGTRQRGVAAIAVPTAFPQLRHHS